MMHPIFDELSLKYKNVVFLRVDGDQHREISGEYGISGFPTFVFVYHGDEVDRVVGADPSGLESKIQQYAQSAQTFTGTATRSEDRASPPKVRGSCVSSASRTSRCRDRTPPAVFPG